MTATIVKRAEWKSERDGIIIRNLFLFQIEKGCFRWQSDSGIPFDGVDYLDIGTAIKAMRVFVESDPSCVGMDLTFFDIAPSPEQRAAKHISDNYCFDGEAAMDQDRRDMEATISQVIASETNIGPMTQAFSELIAFLFTRRPALCFGLALAAMPPLLVAEVNEMIRATGISYSMGCSMRPSRKCPNQPGRIFQTCSSR